MARYVGARCRLCRREGEKLFLKGDRCHTDKCAMERRAYPPGEHGRDRRIKVTNFGLQLREKQKARRIYGILEKQFRNYFHQAARLPGATGENLLQILETRLDNLVFRLGFASSRPQARQLIRHGHVSVNGRKLDIPSARLRAGDVISVRESSRNIVPIEHAVETRGGRDLPEWLAANTKTYQGQLLSLPTRDTIPVTVQENLIVELYSK
ncbi:MAG: 30S ribosomal protein S4 [Candidatus Eisenbacteria bacterium]|uniref:Small ribosomal subunit protein uS4 n=1 Tax=Eiseniibacteriota bacterium TaxID=2212470 RepID=A0A7Y2H108_UNCEI|nr:30S ribosomal protein S4 [Candidatus Eisenbacteria bacterium]